MIPDGWKLVPVEPTEEMRKVGADLVEDWDNGVITRDGASTRDELACQIYLEMLSASHPSPVGEEMWNAAIEAVIQHLRKWRTSNKASPELLEDEIRSLKRQSGEG